jgi:hypothetical protein
MADNKDAVRLILDVTRGAPQQYSLTEAKDALRAMVLDYTGGVTKVTRQSIRDGSFRQLFSVLEEVLPTVVTDVLAGNEIYSRFVDERRIGYGDVNRFLVQDSTLFEVANIADGVGAIRRQRINGPRAVSITTALNGVKVYADEDQILGGKLDITDVIDRVARSMVVKYLTGVLIAFNGLVADNLNGNYISDVGAFDEDAISRMVETVQADTNQPAVIIGTARALRNLQLPPAANAAQNELAALGYYANWYGTPVLAVNQRYYHPNEPAGSSGTPVPGTKDVIFPSDTITILAGEDKFIKLVREGDALIDEYQPHDNPDRTWDYRATRITA